jgi:hypothetical protein
MHNEREDLADGDTGGAGGSRLRYQAEERVRIGLGIDIRAAVNDFMRRNKGVMERLKNL